MSQTLCQKLSIHNLISQHNWKVAIMPTMKMRSKVLAMPIVLPEAVDLALNSRLLTLKSLYFPYQDPLYSQWKGWPGRNNFFFKFQYTSAPTFGASLVAQLVKNPPAIQESQVQSLDQEDPLEKGVAIRSSILAWRTPWTEESGGPQSRGASKSWTWQVTNTFCNNPSKWQ